MTDISKREMKTLKRFVDGKSLPDIKAIFLLEKNGFIRIDPPDDDCDFKIVILQPGLDALNAPRPQP